MQVCDSKLKAVGAQYIQNRPTVSKGRLGVDFWAVRLLGYYWKLSCFNMGKGEMRVQDRCKLTERHVRLPTCDRTNAQRSASIPGRRIRTHPSPRRAPERDARASLKCG